MVTKLKTVPFNKFTGGLITNRPSTDLELNQSPDLDNILLLGTGLKKRNGDVEYNSTAMNSGADVQGLGYFRPTSGTKYLVAVAGDKIFDSDSFDGTMDDRTGGLTVTGGQNNLWTFTNFDNFAIGIGGAPDAPFKMTGGTNATLLGGSPPSGSFGFSMRNRMFIGGQNADPSQIDWSVLSDPEDYSGTGSGSNTAQTNDGDRLVGGIPLNNNVALLFKKFSIHQLIVEQAPFPIRPLVNGVGAVGKNAIVNANGLIYFISNEPRMKATDGYSIINFPDTIDDIFDGLNESRLETIQGIHDKENNLIHWFCSDGISTINNLDIIWDLERKVWLRNTTGFKCNVATIADGNRLFGGHTNGKLYEKYKLSTFNDASETSPGAIDAYWNTPWINFDDIFAIKQMRYADIICKTQELGSVKFSYGFNFNADTGSGEASQESTGGKWDVDTWDSTFIWGGEEFRQKRIFIFGLGNHFQFKIFNDNVGEDMEINSFSFKGKQSGISVINR